MTRSAPLVVLAGAVVAASIVAAYVTPASLLPRPERPFEGYGSRVVRMGGASFPRDARGADDVVARVEVAPRRLVSQSMSTDEYLYSILPPERIVGVSESAYQERISNVYDMARTHAPVVATNVERVLRSNPDLVFIPAEARSDVPGLLRAAGVPVYRIPTMFPTLVSIEEHIRLVGYLSGEDARAEVEARRFRAAIDRAAARKPPGARAPRVMGFGGLYSYGSDTLFSDILRVLGAENVAATHGFVGYDRVTDEHIVRWDPEWIVAGADRGLVAQVRRRLLAHPAIAATTAARRGQVVVLENHIFLPLSPFTSRLVEALAEALYGGTS
ncbi:MAG: ABC transporter substrate-binding protein [Vicinamibacterales bacterium]